MKKLMHRAEDRGAGDFDWLHTRYSFSFANWFDQTRIGFGALRVLNDDRIAPGTGFDLHAHQDMEIVTLVTSGTLTHKDTMGNIGTLREGDVQSMSAGTGISHTEYNASADEPLTLFQLWIEPNVRGIEPRYGERHAGFMTARSGCMLLAAPKTEAGGAVLPLNQDAFLSFGVFDAQQTFRYDLKRKGNGAYIFLVEGAAVIEEETLNPKDAIGISETESIRLTAAIATRLLVVEVPML
jgi:quercetin 2,3-dioxygenase